MRHKLDTIVFSQGWIENQLEKAAEAQTTEEGSVIAATVLEQWKVVSEGIDDLIKENAALKLQLQDIEEAINRGRLR